MSQRTDQAIIPPEKPLHEDPETAGMDECWQGLNSSVNVSRPTCCSPPETANGDILTFDPTELLTTVPPTAAETAETDLKPFPGDTLGPPDSDTPGLPDRSALAWGPGEPGPRSTWASPRLEELVQELARLDPSQSDTFTSYPSPEPSLGLLDGLIPLAEVWAAMRPACREAGEEAAGNSEPG